MHARTHARTHTRAHTVKFMHAQARTDILPQTQAQTQAQRAITHADMHAHARSLAQTRSLARSLAHSHARMHTRHAYAERAPTRWEGRKEEPSRALARIHTFEFQRIHAHARNNKSNRNIDPHASIKTQISKSNVTPAQRQRITKHSKSQKSLFPPPPL